MMKDGLKFLTLWLSQKQLSQLFGVETNNITYYIKNIYKSQELDRVSTTQKIRIVQKEGGRSIERNINHYNLDMIISISYKINSITATQFRKWATTSLKTTSLQDTQ